MPELLIFSFTLPWEYRSSMLQRGWMKLRIGALEEENTELYQIPVAKVLNLFVFLLREV